MKFTLKNLQNNQVYGHSSIVMRMLKDIRGKQSHILPMNGNTYDKMGHDSQYKPNIELEYQWNSVSEEPKSKEKKAQPVMIPGLKDAVNEFEECIKELINYLNDQLETEKEINEEFLEYLESRIANQIQKLTEEKDATIDQLNHARQVKENTDQIVATNEDEDFKKAESIDNESSQIDHLTTLIDANTEEAKKRNLEIRKNTGAITALNAEEKEIRLEDEELRHKKKSEIDGIINKIKQIENGHFQNLENASHNEGLHKAEEATRMFDKIQAVESHYVDPHANDRALQDANEIYDDRLHNIQLLKGEVEVYDKNLDEIAEETERKQQVLEELKVQRNNTIRENLRLEKLLQELMDQEDKLCRERDHLEQTLVPIKDISLRTTRRITNKNHHKASTIRVNMNEKQFELEPDKLGSTLVGKKHNREKAIEKLEEGESKWKSKVNTLYEGVEDLYTPSTLEMDQRAQIHSLLEDIKE